MTLDSQKLNRLLSIDAPSPIDTYNITSEDIWIDNGDMKLQFQNGEFFGIAVREVDS